MNKKIITFFLMMTLVLGLASVSFASSHDHYWIHTGSTDYSEFHAYCTITHSCQVDEVTTIHEYTCETCSRHKYERSPSRLVHDVSNCPYR